ncbi:MAG: metallophosphoesterase [Ferruginibacter sp.]
MGFANFVVCQVAVTPVRNDSTELTFVSDTQAPLWIERFRIKPHNNREATTMIFEGILHRHPAALFMLGDVVSLGYSKRSWKKVDIYLEKFKTENVAVSAALGNHELLGRRGKGFKRFISHFPKYVNTGYVEIVDSVAVILLNSNFKFLSSKADSAQVTWYRKRLKELDADPSVLFIITTCHHSPYSNSLLAGSSLGVQKRFVPLFLKSEKSKLFLSGHSHNFEHYQQEDKNFLVIGGGGGLFQPLRTGEDMLTDLAPDYKPMFHYISVKRSNKQLQVTSQKLKEDLSGFEIGRILDIGY